MKLSIILFLILAVPVARPALRAQQSHTYSVTINPISLVYGDFQSMVEKRFANKTGLAAMEYVSFNRAPVFYRIGALLKYYIIGSFEQGAQAGVQMFYDHFTSSVDRRTEGVLFLAPIAGYKYIVPFGLTFDLSAGAGPGWQLSGLNGSRFFTTFFWNLNAGWSF
ncbi:MAG TPA: hypothetical protein VFH95_16075 [Candidatus Kapabacteria bacterium]|nr:hypothetical protein [Candidatus Kapabacteria bacterium]